MTTNQQLEGYDYTIEHDQIPNNINPRSEQEILEIKQFHDNRQNKLYITNIICIFTICVMLYLTWHFTKNFSKDTLFLGIGIFFFVCYVFRHYIALAIVALMLLPSMLIDSVPIGCVRTETGKVDCV